MGSVVRLILFASFLCGGFAIFFDSQLVVDIHTLECSLIDTVSDLVSKTAHIKTGYQDSQVSFYFWTRENRDNLYEIEYDNDTSLKNSKFDGSKKTYIISHGWTHSGQRKWVLDMKSKLLDVEDANVIALDQPLTSDYTYAVCNVYKIAKHNANFIKWLSEKSKLKPSNIHIIGHSLGAHIAGLTGYYLQQNFSFEKISRITGLDPATSLFSTVDNPNKRLHKSQATFVDVIHTNACDLHWLACVGLLEPVGHVDFYPNGGMHQPNCVDPTEKDLVYDPPSVIPFVCSHQRACDLFTVSIALNKPNDLTFKSWPCSSYEDYKDGKCKECDPQCLEMGFYLNTEPEVQVFYLSTEGEYPFAKGDVQ